MARFLLMLKPQAPVTSVELLDQLQPVLEGLEAEVDHRTPAHLSALLRGGGETQRLQLFADVQAKLDGPVLELVLMSREAMGQGAPQTRAVFERMLDLAASAMPQLDLVFRSDRDGALPA
ncbi:hypothetical protein [Vulcanococcus limneticus]|nr:hypothetical protein [Vulcanococcus limneticus]